jgi:hypothetical protein
LLSALAGAARRLLQGCEVRQPPDMKVMTISCNVIMNSLIERYQHFGKLHSILCIDVTFYIFNIHILISKHFYALTFSQAVFA